MKRKAKRRKNPAFYNYGYHITIPENLDENIPANYVIDYKNFDWEDLYGTEKHDWMDEI